MNYVFFPSEKVILKHKKKYYKHNRTNKTMQHFATLLI